MDDAVRRALERWPNVPAVAGWLRLDRRGDWWIRIPDTDRFERITNPQIIAFIARNYEHDAAGRWFFQNGPQRVYVALEAAPYVVRLDDAAESLVTHTGRPIMHLTGAYADEEGSLVLATDVGVGLVLDRDLAAIADRIADTAGRAIDAEVLFADVAAGNSFEGMLAGERVWFRPIRLEELPERFGFVREPVA